MLCRTDVGPMAASSSGQQRILSSGGRKFDQRPIVGSDVGVIRWPYVGPTSRRPLEQLYFSCRANVVLTSKGSSARRRPNVTPTATNIDVLPTATFQSGRRRTVRDIMVGPTLSVLVGHLWANVAPTATNLAVGPTTFVW